jgi:flagellar biosynthesis protein
MNKFKQQDFASALRFGEDDGPDVIAQGHGALARAIEATARANNIPVLQDFALSQELASIPLGEELSEDLLFAIASVFDYLLTTDSDDGSLKPTNKAQKG